MSEEEKILKISRESPLGCNFWIKMCLTLGLYIFWWSAKKLIVTNRRVIWKKGLIGKSERSVPLGRVQDVSIKYGIIGRIFRYGDIAIETAGGPGTEISVTEISDPEGVKRAILGQVR